MRWWSCLFYFQHFLSNYKIRPRTLCQTFFTRDIMIIIVIWWNRPHYIILVYKLASATNSYRRRSDIRRDCYHKYLKFVFNTIIRHRFWLDEIYIYCVVSGPGTIFLLDSVNDILPYWLTTWIRPSSCTDHALRETCTGAPAAVDKLLVR